MPRLLVVASAASASCITLVDIVGFAVRRLHQSRRCGLRVAVAASAVVSFAGGGCISLAVVSFGQRRTKERTSRSRRLRGYVADMRGRRRAGQRRHHPTASVLAAAAAVAAAVPLC